MDIPNPLPVRTGTTCGTLLNVLLQIKGSEMVKTVVMTATGAAVSFLVSFVLQRLLKRRKTLASTDKQRGFEEASFSLLPVRNAALSG